METLEINQIYNLDCLQGLPLIADATIDLVITDPPFAIQFKAKRGNYHRTPSRVLEGYNEIPASAYYQFSLAWLQQVYRVLKVNGSMYVFSGWNNLKDVLNALAETGFITINHLIWQYQFGVATRRRFVTAHYHCLYVCKDERQRKFFPSARFSQSSRDAQGKSQRYRDMEDVWYIPREYWRGYQKTPTKLPAELIRKILAYSSVEGDLVLDPFLGSGQVAVISKLLKRQYIGFEINPTYFAFAQQRLQSGQYLPLQ